MLTLLLGGARSGKSALAVEWGRSHELAGGAVQFLATAPVSDPSMSGRIERHRLERPDWPTIEEPHDLAAAVTECGEQALVIVDCLTLWVSNLTQRGDHEDEILEVAGRAVAAAGARTGHTVVISNEVGLGIHPPAELGRRFRDLLGLVNGLFAAGSQQALFLVAGRVLELHAADEFRPGP
ncbi:MAG: bifunctional adenosylcobinamide kinase/adenosylcobinamide-phosphate guanylyltransferase [Actinomycetota bacterium]|nr:bifunctional adenosylcobinamide kinase/adenosylcobinamide-phosphate guanylyltransferase [Actinomycetota bacterium]